MNEWLPGDKKTVTCSLGEHLLCTAGRTASHRIADGWKAPQLFLWMRNEKVDIQTQTHLGPEEKYPAGIPGINYMSQSYS